MMDSSPKRSSSFNLDLSDLFVGLSYLPLSNLIDNQKIFNSEKKLTMAHNLQSKNNLNYHLKMDDRNISKKNNILRTMINAFGSFTNVLSKIPNYMTNFNNTLSVTVVPNGGIISSEYILKNLTRRKENLTTYMDLSTNILESVKNKTLHNKLQLIEMEFSGMQQMNAVGKDKLINVCSMLPKNLMTSVDETDFVMKKYNSAYLMDDLEVARMEKIGEINRTKYLNKIPQMPNLEDNKFNKDNVDSSLCTNINNAAVDIDTLNYSTDKINCKLTGEILEINNQLLDKVELIPTRYDECVNLEVSMKSRMPKTRRKCNVVTRNRYKHRGKIQIKKSSVNFFIHRKKEFKQKICCNMQDNMDMWKEEIHETSVMFTETIHNSKFSNDDKLSAIHHSTLERKNSKKIIESPMQSSNNSESIVHDIRSRLLSEGSVDSEDSSFIVFEDESESEDSNSDYTLSSSEDESESDDNENKSNHKVRFTLKPKIHAMIKWDFAYRAARRGPWEEIARDRERFRCRINSVGEILNPILLTQHREQIYQNRFNFIKSNY